MEFFLWLFFLAFWGIVWGCVTQKVIDNKGYDDNWFWWGFLFGVFALIVACTKPQNTYTPSNEPSIYDRYMASKAEKESQPIISNTWRCSCGRINPAYVGTCVCGTSQHKLKKEQEDIARAKKQAEQEKMNQEHREQNRLDNLKLLKEYKELLDSGIITQEEFDQKKSELL